MRLNPKTGCDIVDDLAEPPEQPDQRRRDGGVDFPLEGGPPPSGEVERTFAIVTTDANELMASIHSRMPVMVEAADWAVWLGETEGDPAALLHPAAADVLRLWQISARVNAPRNNDASLLEPVEILSAAPTA